MKKFINHVDDFLAEAWPDSPPRMRDLVVLNDEPVFVRRRT